MRAVLLNDTRIDRHHGCELVVRTIHRLAVENGIEIVASAPAHRDWRDDAAVLAAMESADLVLVNGEGTIHHDRPAGGWLLEVGAWAQSRGIASAMLNMTWQDNSAAAGRRLKAFDIVSVRESASEEQVRAAGVDCVRIPDLALYHDWPQTPARSGVGFTDSVIPAVAASLERVRRRIGGRPLNILYGRNGIMETVRALRRHAVGVGFSSLAGAVRAMVTERSAQTADTDEFMRRLSTCRLLVTGRFHAVILALATRTPVLAVGSNTHKIEATLRDAGLDLFRMVRPEAIDADLIERASQWQPDEAAALGRFLSDGRRRMADLFARLRSLVR